MQSKLDLLELIFSGNTPLLEACSQGHVTVAKLLLDRGAEIDAPTGKKTSFHLYIFCILRILWDVFILLIL